MEPCGLVLACQGLKSKATLGPALEMGGRRLHPVVGHATGGCLARIDQTPANHSAVIRI